MASPKVFMKATWRLEMLSVRMASLWLLQPTRCVVGRPTSIPCSVVMSRVSELHGGKASSQIRDRVAGRGRGGGRGAVCSCGVTNCKGLEPAISWLWGKVVSITLAKMEYIYIQSGSGIITLQALHFELYFLFYLKSYSTGHKTSYTEKNIEKI